VTLSRLSQVIACPGPMGDDSPAIREAALGRSRKVLAVRALSARRNVPNTEQARPLSVRPKGGTRAENPSRVKATRDPAKNGFLGHVAAMGKRCDSGRTFAEANVVAGAENGYTTNGTTQRGPVVRTQVRGTSHPVADCPSVSFTERHTREGGFR